jgi:predicted dehydrogenase
MAAAFATALRMLPDAVLGAVGSRDRAKATVFAAEHDARASYGDYGALAGAEDIDVVYIATPHAMHADNARLFLEAGKPVLLEKPFTLNAAQAEGLIARSRSRKLFLMEAMWTRFVPAVVRLRELIAAGTIGTPQVVIAGGAYIPSVAPEYYLVNRALGGGVLLDAGVYLVSFASMLFGTPTEITGTAELNADGIDVQEAMALRYAQGEVASLYVSMQARQAPAATVLGSEGRIFVHAPIFCPGRLTLSVHGRDDEILELPADGNGYHYQAIEVMQCLRAGATESATMPLAETLEILRTLDALRAHFGVTYPGEST